MKARARDCASDQPAAAPATAETEDPATIAGLVAASMLQQARAAALAYGGTARMWRRPYAEARPHAPLAVAPVWITTYPPSVLVPEGQSVLGALGDSSLWQALAEIGIRAIHTGPTKRGGGWKDGHYTPSVDGNFDRIGFDIDPAFGTRAEYIALSQMAAAYNAVVIDDVIPAHTGKGADFQLACMRYADYPGLYHMVEIPPEDWPLLPDVPPGRDAVNLDAETVDQLTEKGHIVGQLQRVIFFEPGIKETDWSATAIIRGVDGIARRWVYLHYFKQGQPSLNWLDPSFAAQQMVAGDALHSLDVLGARGLRLDANGFLGIERRENGRVWSEGHPLSITANHLLAAMVRKAGGFTFQELNLAVDDIAAMSHGGADLSYDFITRPACQHALVSGDAEFLRMMLRMVHEYGIDPAALIHALQNHDELTLELVHFWTLHANDMFSLAGQSWQGRTLREHIRETVYAAISGPDAPYNQRFVTNGVACTTTSLIAAALGYRDIDHLDAGQIACIRNAHLLLAMYNAFQPGVFALSGWDLVGALPLRLDEVAHLAADGDTRWVARGGYDLTGAAADVSRSADAVPRARCLYGPIPAQLQDPTSFASRLKALLAVRDSYCIAHSQQLAIPDVEAPGLLVMVHELPDRRGRQITALNFGRTPVDEVVMLDVPRSGPVVDIVARCVKGEMAADGRLRLQLQPLQGRALCIAYPLPA